MTNKLIKRGLTSATAKEMQIQTMEDIFSPFGLGKFWSLMLSSSNENVGSQGNSQRIGGIVN